MEIFICVVFDIVFTARRYAIAVYVVVVCLCVCRCVFRSVTSWHCTNG